MRWDVEIAKQFKARNNKIATGPLLGEVICSIPLKIAILGNKAILDNRNSYTCTAVLGANIGDKVLCLPTSDGQTFFIIDKVV
jgi:hypothetical protein